MNILKLVNQWKHKNKLQKEFEDWINKGRPVPPPRLFKQQTLKLYHDKYHLKIFVETGTFRGEMVQAMEDIFNKIYSIELSRELYNEVKVRFKNREHIILIQGDSAVELAKVLQEIDEPALFWLDGHYSGGKTARGIKETPIYEELTHILNAREIRHVILIDDACRFGTDPAYPYIEELKEYILSKKKNASFAIEDDIIRVIL